MSKPLVGLLVTILYLTSLSAELTIEDIFNKIYQTGEWGIGPEDIGHSGPRSTLENTYGYRRFLQGLFLNYNIHSVVDVGCGDWEFSHTINWEGINYIGYDIVSSVILRNQQKHAAPNVHFLQGNAVNIDLPCADLLICKDVLMHLSNEDIMALITQFYKFKYCLLTNDTADNIIINSQISSGRHRPLDLTKPPFSLKGRVLNLKSNCTKQVLFIRTGAV